jgi:hypothetical protein
VSENRDRAHPVQLAEEIMKLVGDADDSTANAALEIARVLLYHRKQAEIEFVSESSQQGT